MLRGAGRQTKLGTVQVGSRMPFDCQGRIAGFTVLYCTVFPFAVFGFASPISRSPGRQTFISLGLTVHQFDLCLAKLSVPTIPTIHTVLVGRVRKRYSSRVAWPLQAYNRFAEARRRPERDFRSCHRYTSHRLCYSHVCDFSKEAIDCSLI